MSNATGILAWTLVLALIPMMIMSFQGYHCASQAVTEATIANLENVAGARASLLAQWIEGQRKELDYLSRTACLPPECGEQCTCRGLPDPVERACRLIGSFRREVSGFEAIAVLATDGSPRGVTGEFPEGVEDLWRENGATIARADEGVVRIWRPARDPSHLFAGVRLVTEKGRSAAFLLACLDLTKPAQRILSIPAGLGDAGRAYIVSPVTNGLILDAGDARNGERGPVVASDDLVRRLTESREGGGIWPDETGGRVVAGFSRVPGIDLSIVVERNQADALQWLPVLARRALIVGLLTAVVVVLFSSWMARRLNRPLHVLADVARSISGGDHVARVPDLKGKEASAVQTALNEMLDALQRSRSQLSQAAALAAVGELSTSIVHEMRNPLSAVKMNLQALNRKVAGDPVHQELAEIARTQVGRIELMLKDLLEYAKPLSVVPRETRLDSVLDLVSGSIDGLARERGVTLSVLLDASIEKLITDPGRLAQALENLLKNAVEASKEGGEVVLRVVEDGAASRRVAFEVLDRGSGLPGGGQGRLFRPFFTCKPEGTGLGLANVRKIIELLGGSVNAYDRNGGGAVFRIVVPVS